MIDFKDLLDYCKAQAILNTLQPTELSVWREICRFYSEKFSTSLHLCLDGTISPEDIMLAVFEEQLSEFDESKDLESILDKIYLLEDPEYEKQKKDELDDFIDKAEKEEEERIAAGKPIHPAMKHEVSLKSLPENQNPQEEKMPTGGKIDLSHLEREENQFSQFKE